MGVLPTTKEDVSMKATSDSFSYFWKTRPFAKQFANTTIPTKTTLTHGANHENAPAPSKDQQDSKENS